MGNATRQDGFWVFREGSGGDGVFHPDRAAAEEEAARLTTGGMAVLVIQAVRFTTPAIETRRAAEPR